MRYHFGDTFRDLPRYLSLKRQQHLRPRARGSGSRKIDPDMIGISLSLYIYIRAIIGLTVPVTEREAVLVDGKRKQDGETAEEKGRAQGTAQGGRGKDRLACPATCPTSTRSNPTTEQRWHRDEWRSADGGGDSGCCWRPQVPLSTLVAAKERRKKRPWAPWAGTSPPPITIWTSLLQCLYTSRWRG